nr:MAG TPA: hypothetical protein [Caudoviricetes sp.]
MYVADGEAANPPEIPQHQGMIFQGWNCALDDIHGHRDIGAIYTTESGACEFDDPHRFDGHVLSLYRKRDLDD